jgi:enhancer of polycomb-like protein
LQAVISGQNAAALGAKAEKQNYIPTPDATRAKDVQYDSLYPKVFRQPTTYIRFSSTVEDSIGVQYCMSEEDAKFLAQLNDGRDVHGQPVKEKLSQCSEDVFEEAMDFFEETSQRLQPFANVDNAPILSLEEMEQAREEPISADAQKFLKLIYQYWVSRKSNRPIMPAIKVRLLDTTSDIDDADPYVCFRRREVRQTRKTRGRDAQIVEKLKKLRVELEMARNLVRMVQHREELNKSSLELNRKVFDGRRKLKEVKATKGIKGENGEDELLLVNQKVSLQPAPRISSVANADVSFQPAPKVKARQDSSVARPATIRLRSLGERTAPEDNLVLLSDNLADADAFVNRTIESRKEQHRKWNANWHDRTWNPITPPPEPADDQPKWAPLFPQGNGYPTPPPSQKSGSPVDGDGDIDMQDRKPSTTDLEDASNSYSQQQSRIHIIQAFSATPLAPLMSTYFSDSQEAGGSTADFEAQQKSIPQCRVRYGRGGRRFLEARRTKVRAIVRAGAGVVSDDDDSDDDDVERFIPVSDDKVFEYRMLLNRGGLGGGGGGGVPGPVRSESSNGERRTAAAAAAAGGSSSEEQQQGGANAAANPSPKPAAVTGSTA